MNRKNGDQTTDSNPGAPGRGVEQRLEEARLYFRRHHANVQPDPGFADRVASRLRHEPVELLGWAALRLLPVTLALLLILGWIALRPAGPSQVQAAQGDSGDLIAWVLEEPEVSP